MPRSPVSRERRSQLFRYHQSRPDCTSEISPAIAVPEEPIPVRKDGAMPKVEKRIRRKKVTIVLTDEIEAAIVTRPPRAHDPRATRHGKAHVAKPQPTTGCIFSGSTPTSTDESEVSLVVAKYTVAGDATSSDSVTFEGGPRISRFRVAPIFYGTAWLTSAPTYLDVNEAIRALLRSPYLSELDQYGFAHLELIRPVLVNETVATSHGFQEAADVVSSLINTGAVEKAVPGSDSIIYTLFYPSGTSVSDINACGWHYTASGAWVAVIEFPDDGGTTAVTVNNIMRIFSHELVETLTDPEADPSKDGWVMNRAINGGREIGDACNNTDDFTAGVFVNAYWSERHKACIIPQPRRVAAVSSVVEITNETEVSSGTVTFRGDPLDIRTCLNGTYSFTNSFVAQRARFFATSSNFGTPTYKWMIVEAKGGPLDLPDGFNSTVLLSLDTWSDGPDTSTHQPADVPVAVSVVGDELTVSADTPGADYFNFSVLVQVTATEGVLSATALGRQLFTCQKFEWDDNYKTAVENCKTRLNKLVLEAIQLTRFIDKGDPINIWFDGVTRWIGGGERVAGAARAASVAAAIEKTHPDLGVRLRALASVAYQIPATLMSKTAEVTSG
jgi:hypothetical protein